MRPGLSPSAFDLQQRGYDPGLRGVDSEPADHSVDWPKGEQTNFRDAPVLSDGMGHRIGTAAAPGPIEDTRLTLPHATASLWPSAAFAAARGLSTEVRKRAMSPCGWLVLNTLTCTRIRASVCASQPQPPSRTVLPP